MKKVVKRLLFPTDYRSKQELRSGIVLSFLICIGLMSLSTAFLTYQFITLSKTLLLGTVAYELILFYLLREYAKQYLNEVKGIARKGLELLEIIIFGSMIGLTFIVLISIAGLPSLPGEDKTFSLIISLIIISLPTIFWNELITIFRKGFGKHTKLFAFFFLLCVLSTSVAHAEGNASLFSSFSQVGEFLEKGINFANQIQEFFDVIQSSIGSAFNLNEGQTQIVSLVIILCAAFFILKFMGFIVKWVIVILIVWILLQLFFF